MTRLIFLRDNSDSWVWKNQLFFDVARSGEHSIEAVDIDADVDFIVNSCREADAVLWCRSYYKTPGGSNNESLRLLKELRRIGVVSIGIHWDCYWNTPVREHDIGSNAWWFCDFVFTPDGDSSRDWNSRSVQHFYSPPAASVSDFDDVSELISDHPSVVFVGMRSYPHIRWTHRTALVDWLSATYGDRFRWYGPLSDFGEVHGEDLRRVYKSSKVIVSDGWPSFGTHGVSNRLPQSCASGTSVIHPRCVGVTEPDSNGFSMYREGIDLLSWDLWDWDELKLKVDVLLDSNSYGSSAKERTWDRHLMLHRVNDMLRIVGLHN